MVDDFKFDIVQSYPEAPVTDAPEHTPPAVAAYYSQAHKALEAGLWDAAGAMARKTMDVATKLLKSDKATAGDKLVTRIDRLANSHKITPQLAEWAHAVRLDGNHAAHDLDPFTEEQATQICAFTDMFLTYVYTMPGMLAARRSAKQPGDIAEG